MQSRKVDVAILGSGSAGLYALGKVKAAGKSFVLINGGEAGTTCARVGCMPSKAIIQIAEDFHRRKVFARHGIRGMENLSLDIPAALEHVQDLRDTFVDRVLSNSTDKMGDLFIEGYAHFIAPNQLQVDTGEIIEAASIIIATGSSPIVPDAWRTFGDKIVTTDSFFELDALPDSMAVIGLGVIGLELGQTLARLGVKVTGFDLATRIGGLTDPEVNQAAIEAIGLDFPLHLGVKADISEADKGQLMITAGKENLLVDKVLVVIGRQPNIHGLNLSAADLPLDAKGMPVYNPQTMQIGDSRVFIAGDVNGARPLLHEAGDEGRIAGFNACADDIVSFQRKVPLGIVFSDPNICQIGRPFDQLDPAITAIGQIQLGPVGRAMIMAKNRGLIRVYADKASGRLLGAEMVTVKGENLAHLLAWAIEMQMTVGQMLQMPFYHPVLEEALQAALYDLYVKVDAKNTTPVMELRPC